MAGALNQGPVLRNKPAADVSLLINISLDGCEALADIRLGVQKWHNQGSALLHINGFGDDYDMSLISEVLEAILRQDCQHITESDAKVPILAALEAHGFVEQCPKLRLTDLGSERVEFTSSLSDPELVFEPRSELPLEDRTPFEMLVMLQDAGWEWRKLPMAQLARSKLIYRIGERKLFYTALRVNPAYLHVLLTSEHLNNEYGIDVIPHYAQVEVYKDLLAGKPWQPTPAAPALPAFEPDMEIAGALEDGAVIADAAVDPHADMLDAGFEDLDFLAPASPDDPDMNDLDHVEGAEGQIDLEVELIRILEEEDADADGQAEAGHPPRAAAAASSTAC